MIVSIQLKHTKKSFDEMYPIGTTICGKLNAEHFRFGAKWVRLHKTLKDKIKDPFIPYWYRVK